jgi:F-type H+-transporting ATPase subunit delta
LSAKSTFSNATAKSYALALFELCMESSQLEKVAIEIMSLNDLIKKSVEFKEVISNPTVTKEEKTNVISRIADKNSFSEILKNFLIFVATKNRLFFLNKIIESFLNLVSKHKGELKAKLISSKELSKEEKNKIQNELSQDFKSSLNIDYQHDPSLLAGLVIQIGSMMVDTSIKSKLKKLQKNMVEI